MASLSSGPETMKKNPEISDACCKLLKYASAKVCATEPVVTQNQDYFILLCEQTAKVAAEYDWYIYFLLLLL